MPPAIASLALALAFAAAGTAAAADPTVVTPPGRKAMAPEMAVAKDGAIHLVWIERTPAAGGPAGAAPAGPPGADLWFARSTDGTRFTAPVRVNHEPGVVWGFPVSRPRVATSADGTIHVFHPGTSQVEDVAGPVVLPMYVRSTDQGLRFSRPVVLGGVPAPGSPVGPASGELFGTMTTDLRGGVYAYWLDNRGVSTEAPNATIYSAVSTDNGSHFGREFPVYPAADACPCCQLTATVARGRLYMGSRQVGTDGSRDSVVAVSRDRGRSFGPRARWGGAAWPIDACPLKATAIAVDGRKVYAASFNGGAEPQGAYVSRSTNGGASFEPAVPLHPGAAMSDAPVLAVLDNGAVVAAWHAKTTGDRRIHLAVSRDGGRRFSPPVELPAPPGPGTYPVMVSRKGGVQLAWQQGDAVVTTFLSARDPLLRPRAAAN